MHRRVDRPSAARGNGIGAEKPKPRAVTKLEDGDEGEPERFRSVRSLALTSDRLGLTATLDLAEIDGTRAVPVEYRRGRPRHVTDGSEPADEMMGSRGCCPDPSRGRPIAYSSGSRSSCSPKRTSITPRRSSSFVWWWTTRCGATRSPNSKPRSARHRASVPHLWSTTPSAPAARCSRSACRTRSTSSDSRRRRRRAPSRMS